MKNPNFACCWSDQQATLNIRVNNLTKMSHWNASVQKKRCQNEIIGPEQIRTTTVNIKTLISTISTFLAQIKKIIKCLVCSVWMFKLIWRPKIISIPRIFWSKSDLSQLSSIEVKVYGILNLEGSWTNLETKFIYNCYEHSSSISFWIWKFEEI